MQSFKLSRELIFDIETNGCIQEKNLPNIIIVGISSTNGSVELFGADKLNIVQKYLLSAQRVIGFGIQNFDIPLLFGPNFVPAEGWLLDLLHEVRMRTGHRVSLQSLARATLARSRFGTGKLAASKGRKGDMDYVRAHVIRDVLLIRALYMFGVQHGCIYLRERGKSMLLKVNWS